MKDNVGEVECERCHAEGAGARDGGIDGIGSVVAVGPVANAPVKTQGVVDTRGWEMSGHAPLVSTPSAKANVHEQQSRSSC